MARAPKKRKTMISSQRYSTEEVIAAVMELDSDSCDSSDTFTSSSNEEFNPTPLEKNNPTPQTLSIPTPSSPKRYTELQNVNSSPPSSESSAKSSTIHLEFSSSGNTPQSLSPHSDSTYGKYSTTDSTDSTSNTGSLNSSPTFPSDNSTESTNTPLFPEDTQNDTDSESSFADFNVEDINIPQSETVIKKRAVLQLNEIPFSLLMQWIRAYLLSIEVDPNKPEYPVPDMDKNQKRNFRRTTKKFRIVNGHLKHLHVYVDEKNKIKRGELFIVLYIIYNFLN